KRSATARPRGRKRSPQKPGGRGVPTQREAGGETQRGTTERGGGAGGARRPRDGTGEGAALSAPCRSPSGRHRGHGVRRVLLHLRQRLQDPQAAGLRAHLLPGVPGAHQRHLGRAQNPVLPHLPGGDQASARPGPAAPGQQPGHHRQAAAGHAPRAVHPLQAQQGQAAPEEPPRHQPHQSQHAHAAREEPGRRRRPPRGQPRRHGAGNGVRHRGGRGQASQQDQGPHAPPVPLRPVLLRRGGLHHHPHRAADAGGAPGLRHHPQGDCFPGSAQAGNQTLSPGPDHSHETRP
ncbi:unnamed protein product, partial [Tetraodon nigroviridis]